MVNEYYARESTTFKLDPELLSELAETASAYEVSRNDLVEHALREFFNSFEQRIVKYSIDAHDSTLDARIRFGRREGDHLPKLYTESEEGYNQATYTSYADTIQDLTNYSAIPENTGLKFMITSSRKW